MLVAALRLVELRRVEAVDIPELGNPDEKGTHTVPVARVLAPGELMWPELCIYALVFAPNSSSTACVIGVIYGDAVFPAY